MVMSIYDKVIYYSGITAIVIASALIIAGIMGVAINDWTGYAKAAVVLVAGIGLFMRGYRAKQLAKQREAQEILNSLFNQPDKSDKSASVKS